MDVAGVRLLQALLRYLTYEFKPDGSESSDSDALKITRARILTSSLRLSRNL